MGQIRRQVVEDLDGLELAGICDQYLDPAIIGAQCRHFTDYKTALDETEPDLVFVCTPNSFSPEICVYALERGCHVFCEKPPGRNVEDIRRIIAAEQAQVGLKVMFGFNHRHHPAILEAKSIVDAGRMGRILWLRGLYGKSGGGNESFEDSWRNNPAVSGGGILLDQGIHMLDLFRFFCGDFSQIQGMLTTSYWDIPVEDNAFVLLRSEEGQTAQLHSSATLWKHTFQLDIGLEEGYLSAQGLLSKSGSYGRETLVIGRKPRSNQQGAVGNPREEVVYFDRDLSWELQVRELVKCIHEDRPVTDSSTTDALRVMEIIDAVYQQAGVARCADLARKDAL
jgi:predicted dehydrogenase